MSEYEVSENFLDHTEEWTEARADETARAMAFRQLLQKMDARLDLIYVKEGAFVLEGGYYYIVRHNDIGVKSHWQVHDGDGKPCVPDSRHYDMMKANDLTNVDVKRELAEMRRRKDAEKAKNKAARSERFRETLLDRLNHLYDARIAVPNAQAEAERKKRIEAGPVVARA